jgi:2-methylcitrate dehydratase PrpD
MKELAKVDELWGDPDRSLARTDLVGEFETLSRGRLSNKQVRKIVSSVESLRDGSVGPLLDALRSVVPMTSISSGEQTSDSLTGT